MYSPGMPSNALNGSPILSLRPSRRATRVYNDWTVNESNIFLQDAGLPAPLLVSEDLAVTENVAAHSQSLVFGTQNDPLSTVSSVR